MADNDKTIQPLSIMAMSDSSLQELVSHLAQYNKDHSHGLYNIPGERIGLVVHDDGGSMVGGIACRTFYNSAVIDQIWIEEQHRGKGYGRGLVTEVEKQAKELGCVSIQTSSYSFQAPEFYQKLGYEVFGVFEGYPKGIKKYYLGKYL
jgi:ribosomal protein S18 acetylase RimI-like enzyme